MKKCPTCDRTFEDSLKFCQIDGTPLVAVTETKPEDSFKTMVGNLISKEDEDLPKSSSESFSQSPFDSSPGSPFGSSAPSFKEPEPMFDEPQTPYNQSPFGGSPPFDSQSDTYNAPGQQSQWSPPPAPISEWQNQNSGQNVPFQAGVITKGQDKTLAIVSLVCGILSLTCCGPVTGIAALITGFMAKNNVDADPLHYTGRGLAVAGMIMGGISVALTVVWLIFAVIGGIFR